MDYLCTRNDKHNQMEVQKITDLKEIKRSVDAGETVYVGSLSYTVIKENDRYFIHCSFNNTRIGLYGANQSLNGSDFFKKL